ncbi:MAG: hypothetical protein ACLQBX_12465 [Candidatus Limnocylindrales bacterium]
MEETRSIRALVTAKPVLDGAGIDALTHILAAAFPAKVPAGSKR